MILGRKADDFFVAVKRHLDDIQPGRLDASLHAFQGAATTIVDLSGDLKPQDIAHLIYNAKATLLFTQLSIVLAIITAAVVIRRLGRFIHHVRKSLTNLSNITEVQKNIHYQSHFATSVHQFIEYHHELHNKGPSASLPAVYYVYHPGNDWHASFHAKKLSVNGFGGVYDDLTALIEHLDQLRRIQNSTDEIYILLPSAHRYILPAHIRFSTDLLPLKMRGQKDYNGEPLCRLPIGNVLPGVDVKDVELVPKKPRNRWFYYQIIGALLVIIVGLLIAVQEIESSD
jgi:hypothetical protein